MKKILSILLLGCCVVQAYSQQEIRLPFFKRVLTRPPYDTNYVDSYYDHFLHVTLLSVRQRHDLQISNSLDKVTVKYKPNGAFTFGIGLDYRYFSIEYTKAIKSIDSPDPTRGNTQSYSFRLGVTGRRILASALIQSYTGMYISNSNDVILGWTQKEPYVRPDITSSLLLGSMNYFYNHRFYSTMASLWQIDRQKKSAGSFITGVTASASNIRGDSALIPLTAGRSFSSKERIKENTNYLVGVNVGYGHNFIFRKKFFLNLLMVPGINLQYGHYRTSDNIDYNYKSRIGYHGDFRIVAGYNGERYYSGVHYSNYFLSNPLETNIDLNLFNGYLRFFVGRRFDTRPKAKRH